MQSASFDLAEAVVRSPKKILQDAIDKIEENYWTESFMLEGFYRKAALEADKFTFLTEAIIQVFNKGYQKTLESSLGINIVHLRASEDYRYIETIQGRNPLLIGLYDQDHIKHRGIRDILKERKDKIAKVETSVYNGENIYIIKLAGWTFYIGFENDEIYRMDLKSRYFESSHQYRKYKGKLYQFYHRRKYYVKKGSHIGQTMVGKYGHRDIQKEAIIDAENQIEQNPGRNNNNNFSDELDRKERITKRVHRQKSKEILRTTDLDNIGWIHEFTATKILLKSRSKYKEKSNFVEDKDLFETEVYYDKRFWESYNLPSESKFLQAIQADLEAAANGKTLVEQFASTGAENNQKNFRKKKKSK